MATLTVAQPAVTANASAANTKWSQGAYRVCNGTLFCVTAAVYLTNLDGTIIGTLDPGQGLDVTGQDLDKLFFKDQTSDTGGSLGFFGTVHVGGN